MSQEKIPDPEQWNGLMKKLDSIENQIKKIEGCKCGSESLTLYATNSNTIHIPPFISDDVDLWFAQVDASFSRVLSDSTEHDGIRKYNILVSHLDHAVASHPEIRKLIIPRTEPLRPYGWTGAVITPYTILKEKIIEVFSKK